MEEGGGHAKLHEIAAVHVTKTEKQMTISQQQEQIGGMTGNQQMKQNQEMVGGGQKNPGAAGEPKWRSLTRARLVGSNVIELEDSDAGEDSGSVKNPGVVPAVCPGKAVSTRTQGRRGFNSSSIGFDCFRFVLYGGAILLACAALLLIGAVSIIPIVIGINNSNNCPAQPRIPTMLLTLGLLSIANAIFSSCARVVAKTSGSSCYSWLAVLGQIAELVIIIWTAVMVYGMYSTVSYTAPGSDEENANQYCDRLTYLYAFWYVTLILAPLGIVILATLCVCISSIGK